MKISEAPPAGWYPDPSGGTRLRWWDGKDWADRYRSRPNLAAPVSAIHGPSGGSGIPGVPGLPGVPSTLSPEYRRLADDVVAQARQAARSEIDRAADVFSTRVRAATREIEPLISQYTSRFLRWVKLLLAIVILLVIAWFVFDLVAKATFFEWVGDRIDGLRSGDDP